MDNIIKTKVLENEKEAGKERYDRLSFKTRDRQFQQEAIEGLSCSPLEAKALTAIVKDVSFRKKIRCR